MRGSRRGLVTVGAVAAALALPGLALAHIERPSYWPDPAADTSVSPPAGGKVPKVRPLSDAVTGKGPGEVRVVCIGQNGTKSMKLLRKSVRKAKKSGYKVRPSQKKLKLSRNKARKLVEQNRKLAKQCEYSEIQPAVFDSGNNDRVVIMPGTYREPTSRAQPLNDPKCADMTQQDSGGAETPSYRYQVTCPNDQNLVYVQGRAVPDAPPPEPPLDNRQGIPDEGPCVRCNLQLEGSGVAPTDVIVDGGGDYAGKGPEARPGSLDKHVDIRVDRADGFVVHNLTTRGALEHGIYVEETDGYRIDTVKMFWAADYGNLTFTSDHGLYRNCDGFGAGDAVVYPGAAPETGEQADLSFYPDAPRINTVVKKCDMRGSVLAYSGSMGNAVRITKNHVYANAAGLSTDTISASGHPGFPADSVEVDHNLIYSNNLDLFEADPPVEPVVGVLPVGTGIFWAGHNNGRVHDNWIFDNWRAGTYLLSVPDALVTPEGAVNPGISCPTAPMLTTSCGNEYFDNHMGRAPKGFRMHKAARKFGNPVGGKKGKLPNGVDFWWDEAASNTGNCWYDNVGPDGKRGSITAGAGDGADALPSNCDNTASGDSVKLAYLLSCFLAREGDLPPESCDWYETPPKPGSAVARRKAERWEEGARKFLRTERATELQEQLDGVTGIADSSPTP
jgi:hypothetical protein